ncbi:MAG: ATP-binding protein [Bacteroidota bacterium]
MSEINKVSIELKPGVYNQFRSLNNKVWFALSEYVDNAVQSYLFNKELLCAVEPDYQFTVSINMNWENKELIISDNAAGIDSKNFQRAFEPANIPDNNTGLNEFGMGLKTASIWLANKWEVYSKAIHEDVERSIMFDLKKVIQEEREELQVINTHKDPKEHYTIVVLKDLSDNAPKVLQMKKIKLHLASIYRKFIREGELRLIINEEELTYKDPVILSAPYYKTPNGNNILWKKEIVFQTPSYRAVGFIGLLETMSSNEVNGFSLFRRGRVILGSHDEKYRPKSLCGTSGTGRYKRIFGELELEGFEVSFNKSSFQDDGNLEEFIELLKDEISNPIFDLYGQAEYYRPPKKDNNAALAKQIVSTLKKETQPHELTQRLQESVKTVVSDVVIPESILIVETSETLGTHEVPFEFDDQQYTLKVELVNEPFTSELYALTIQDGEYIKNKEAVCKVNLAHTFFVRFDNFKKDGDYQPIIAIIKALVLAEIVAPSQGVRYAGTVRELFNKYLQ